jgi:hypothetical protein
MRRNKSLARPARQEETNKDNRARSDSSESKEFYNDDVLESGRERHKVRLLSKPDAIWTSIDASLLEDKEPGVEIDQDVLSREENDRVIKEALSMLKIDNLNDPGIHDLVQVELKETLKSLDDSNWRFETETWIPKV